MATVVAYTAAVMVAYVLSKSMESTVHVHSIIVGWRLPYVIGDSEPQHGEIVIFKDNKERGVLLISID